MESLSSLLGPTSISDYAVINNLYVGNSVTSSTSNTAAKYDVALGTSSGTLYYYAKLLLRITDSNYNKLQSVLIEVQGEGLSEPAIKVTNNFDSTTIIPNIYVAYPKTSDYLPRIGFTGSTSSSIVSVNLINGYNIVAADTIGTSGYSSDAYNLVSIDLSTKGVLGKNIDIIANVASATKLATARSISISGAGTGSVSFDGTANVTIPLTLSNSGVTAGTYKSVTVNNKGLVTSGTNPTTLSGYGITDAVTNNTSQSITGTKTFVNKITGNIDTAVAFNSARTIELTGPITGSVSSDGTSGWSIATTINTGVVTNSMLAGSIANSKLAHSSITIGSTNLSLGGSSTTLTGLTSVTSTKFVGALNGNADTASNLNKSLAATESYPAVVYQSGNNTTSLLSKGTAGQYLYINTDGNLTWANAGTGITSYWRPISYYATSSSTDLVSYRNNSAVNSLILRAGDGVTLSTVIADNTANNELKITANINSITLSGDVTSLESTTGKITTTIKNSGVTAGTYKSVTVNAKGIVTSGSNPTTVAGYGITNAVTTDTSQTISGNKTFTGSILGNGSLNITSSYNSGSSITLRTYSSSSSYSDVIISNGGSLSARSLTLGTALSVANGGSGATTLPQNRLLVGNGTSAITSVAAPTESDHILLSTLNGAPIWSSSQVKSAAYLNASTSNTANTVVLRDSSGKVSLDGSITSATKASQDASGNIITTTYGASISKTQSSNGDTISLLSKGYNLLGSAITLTPASSTLGGIVNTSAQTFAGDKTFSNLVTIKNTDSNGLKLIRFTNDGEMVTHHIYDTAYKIDYINNDSTSSVIFHLKATDTYGGNNGANPSTSLIRFTNASNKSTVTADVFSGNLNGLATSATRASQDASGNSIESTYLKRSGGELTGNLIVNGNTTLGDTNTDFVTFNAQSTHNSNSSFIKSIYFNRGIQAYTLGSVGPGGGYVFYDAGSNQTSYYLDSNGNEQSFTWRFLEVSPSDITCVTPGGVTINPPWGVNYNGSSWEWHSVDNMSALVGDGRYNTTKLVNYLGADFNGNYYDSSAGHPKAGAGNYAANLCLNYAGGGKSDWWLPSIEELKFIYVNLHRSGIRSLTNSWYWSSSQYSSGDAWNLIFNSGILINDTKSHRSYARAVRGITG